MATRTYHAVSTTQWVVPESYGGVDYRREDGDYASSSYPGLEYIRRGSVSAHRQPSSDDYYDDERREDRYGSSYRPTNDPSAFLPELSTSPSISSGSSIETPSIRSYQTKSGSYFPPAMKGYETRYEETELRDLTQYRDIGDDVRDAGSLFSNLKLEDKYSGRMDSRLYDNLEPVYPPREYGRRVREDSVGYEVEDGFDEAASVISTRSRRHSILRPKSQFKQPPPPQEEEEWLPTPSTEKTEKEIQLEVDDIFDDAEDTVTADDWTMESNLRPGITGCGKEAVRVLRESEAINKDLRAVAAALAAFRAKRKQRPSFSARTTPAVSKSKTPSSVFSTGRREVDERERHRRERYKHR